MADDDAQDQGEVPESILEAQRSIERMRSDRPPATGPAPLAEAGADGAEGFLASLIGALPPPVDRDQRAREAEAHYAAERRLRDAAADREVKRQRPAVIARLLEEWPLTGAQLELLRKADASDALQAVRGWLNSVEKGSRRTTLILLGPTGVGKTFAAAAGLTERVRVTYRHAQRSPWDYDVVEPARVVPDTPPPRYLRIRDVCRLHRSEWGDERKAWEAILEAHTVVVDEIGHEGDLGLATRALYELIDSRLAARTILIGNLSKAQFVGGYTTATPGAGRYDGRMYDRLREMGALREIGGASLRRGSL